MTTGVALPDYAYLARIGEVAYTASSLEWTLLGDLAHLAASLPTGPRLEDLEPRETGAIARQIKDASKHAAAGPLRDYLVAAYRALFAVAEIRSDVLHARPATHPAQGQRLLRAEVRDKATTGHRFWIDDAWLDDAISQLRQAVADVNLARSSAL